jgi:hypothetical protein
LFYLSKFNMKQKAMLFFWTIILWGFVATVHAQSPAGMLHSQSPGKGTLSNANAAGGGSGQMKPKTATPPMLSSQVPYGITTASNSHATVMKIPTSYGITTVSAVEESEPLAKAAQGIANKQLDPASQQKLNLKGAESTVQTVPAGLILADMPRD